jgi:hypothetical protein
MLQHRENLDTDVYNRINDIVKRDFQQTNGIGKKNNNAHYHSKGTCKYGSECACVFRKWIPKELKHRNEVTVEMYHYSVGTGYLQKGLLIVGLTN